MTQRVPIKLSICIATYNRADFISETLDSITSQMTNECEIVISDNGSTDGTEQVVSEYARRFERVRYVRHTANVGLDRNFDRAAELAQGEYCWLMPDDDLLKPRAVMVVLEALRRSYSLIIVNYERMDISMSKVLISRYLDIDSNRVFGPEDLDEMFEQTVGLLIYIGCIVIKRAVWFSRNRERYYGSMLMYIGVIFQERLSGETLLIAEPLISYREGNVLSYSPELFEIFLIKFPALVWSLAPSELAKKKIVSREPWRNNWYLVVERAMGNYSLSEFHRWIYPRRRSRREVVIPFLVSLLPGVLMNILFVWYYSTLSRQRFRNVILQAFSDSRFYWRKQRVFRLVT